ASSQAEHIHFELEPAPPVPPEIPFSEEIAASQNKLKPSNPDYSRRNAKIAGPISTPASEVTGSLDGKIVYLMGGHGWTYNGSEWHTQRFEYNEMVEDFGNQDQATIMA